MNSIELHQLDGGVRHFARGGELKEFIPLVNDETRNDFPLLAGIVPYEDASFNSVQAAILREELREYAARVGWSQKSVIEDLVVFVEKCRPGMKLVFLGD